MPKRIPFNSNIPDGVETLLTISKVDYDEPTGKLVLTISDDEQNSERLFYNVLNDDGETYNRGAINSLAGLSKVILGNDIDGLDDPVEQLTGTKFIADVSHTEGSTGKSYIRISNYKSAILPDDDLPF